MQVVCGGKVQVACGERQCRAIHCGMIKNQKMNGDVNQTELMGAIERYNKSKFFVVGSNEGL